MDLQNQNFDSKEAAFQGLFPLGEKLSLKTILSVEETQLKLTHKRGLIGLHPGRGKGEATELQVSSGHSHTGHSCCLLSYPTGAPPHGSTAISSSRIISQQLHN